MPLLKNKIVIYLFTRYLTYGLQFLLALIIAVRLGPYYLGVYGILQLLINYFEQFNFGIPHSLNVFLIHNKNDKRMQERFTLNSIAIYSYICIVCILIAVVSYLLENVTWGDYAIGKYIWVIILIAICSYYNAVLTMVVRVRNQVNTLSIVGMIPVALNLMVVFLFVEETLVLALLVTNLISYLIVLFILYRVGAMPRLVLQDVSTSLQLSIIKKGLYLFLYNSCFYFILIGVRTLISQNYTVEEYGYFTFSFTIANAVLLLLSSLNTIIFPKTIDIMSSQDVNEKQNAIKQLRVGYITTANLLVYVAMICFPLVTMFFSKYELALTSMNLTALAILMNTNSYGFISLLIAQNREKLTFYLSCSAFVLSMIIGCVLVFFYHVVFSYVVISVMGGYLLFSLLGYYFGSKELSGVSSIKDAILHFFPLKFSLPYITAVVLSVYEVERFMCIPLLIFVVLNYNDLKYLLELVTKLIRNPNMIDV